MLASAALVLAGTAASAVGGGTTVGNDAHRYVAKIQGPAGACTGSLVAPLWVITAKNCVPHDANGVPAGATTLTVGRGDLTSTAGRVQQATKVVPRADRDLALVKLSIPVLDLPFLALATTAPATDAPVQVIGYGRTTDTWVPDKASIAPFTVGALGSATFAVTSPSGKDTCKGDAGGPTLLGDKLAGITSTSWQHGCLTVTETRQGGTQARVDDIAAWIRQTIDVVPAGTITGPAGKCIENINARLVNGNPVQYHSCNTTGTQNWVVAASGMIELQNKCIEVVGGNTANGTRIQVAPCTGEPKQNWTAHPDGSYRALGKCLDVANGINANGTPMQLHDCNGSPAQRWTISVGSLQAFGRCLDLPGGYATEANLLQLHDCNGTAAQQWRPGDGRITTAARCMGAAGDQVANGTLIEIFDCGGTPGQRWLPRDDGTILNPPSGRCLDLRFADTSEFAVIQLHDCNASVAQKWTIAV
ncbi:ricin-type beta-trefoil lectin domain protein [Lentzea californiensis]|uniref:ricin-type beta-trefoil lectin domain protein n=1 Tax=Lentzea californiensis TaxID=438851 RepID=UPI0021658365|nr:ricin-type beta-trefoil lectin domain protein [Lentzea californiensis]